MESEAEIVKKMLRALRALPKCAASKIHGDPYQEKGIPDIMGCFEGYAFVIEAKRPNKRGAVSPYQKVQLKRYKRAGARVGVATSVDEALAIAKGDE
jgi:hypothetical protein